MTAVQRALDEWRWATRRLEATTPGTPDWEIALEAAREARERYVAAVSKQAQRHRDRTTEESEVLG